MSINYKYEHKSAGLTLVEILIATLIGFIVLVAVMSTLTRGFTARNRAVAVTSLQKTASSILADMTINARWAESVSINDLGNLTMIIRKQDGTVINYVYDDVAKKLTKSVNGNPANDLHEKKIEITSFGLQTYPDPVNINRIVVEIGLTYLPDDKITYDTTFAISVRIGEINY